jgi:predicted ATPase
MTLFRRGELQAAHPHLAHPHLPASQYEAGQLDDFVFAHGRDPRTIGRSSLGLVLWYMGYPDQALTHSEAALAKARSLGNFVNVGQTLLFYAELHQLRREVRQAKDCAEASVALATEQGFPVILAWGTIIRGWALAQMGEAEEGVAQLRRGLADYQATGCRLGWSYFLARLAESYALAGQPAAGRDALDQALDMVRNTGERYYEAELHRLEGAMVLASASGQSAHAAAFEAAEVSFTQALDIARRQGARSLELRAATSLARIWREQGRSSAARQMLEGIYGSFTEGFETVDLREAKALLGELAAIDRR